MKRSSWSEGRSRSAGVAGPFRRERNGAEAPQGRVLADAPLVYVDKRYRVGASSDIVLLPEQGDDAQRLLANADIAMYEAKRVGALALLCLPNKVKPKQRKA